MYHRLLVPHQELCSKFQEMFHGCRALPAFPNIEMLIEPQLFRQNPVKSKNLPKVRYSGGKRGRYYCL